MLAPAGADVDFCNLVRLSFRLDDLDGGVAKSDGGVVPRAAGGAVMGGAPNPIPLPGGDIRGDLGGIPAPAPLAPPLVLMLAGRYGGICRP